MTLLNAKARSRKDAKEGKVQAVCCASDVLDGLQSGSMHQPFREDDADRMPRKAHASFAPLRLCAFALIAGLRKSPRTFRNRLTPSLDVRRPENRCTGHAWKKFGQNLLVSQTFVSRFWSIRRIAPKTPAADVAGRKGLFNPLDYGIEPAQCSADKSEAAGKKVNELMSCELMSGDAQFAQLANSLTRNSLTAEALWA